jgi:hypothetical protein
MTIAACVACRIVATGVPLAACPLAVEPPQATLEIRLVQVDLDRIAALEIEGGSLETSRSWGITMGISIGDGVRLKPPVFHLGEKGELRIGSERWALGAALDDAERGIVRPGSPFTVLAAPRVVCGVGEKAAISIGAEVEWMVRDEQGCLRLADERDGPAIDEGVEITLRLASANGGAIELDPVDVRLRRVVDRETIPGVPLAVGRPVVREDRVRRDVRVLDRETAVMPLGPIDDEARDLILVVVSRVLPTE